MSAPDPTCHRDIHLLLARPVSASKTAALLSPRPPSSRSAEAAAVLLGPRPLPACSPRPPPYSARGRRRPARPEVAAALLPEAATLLGPRPPPFSHETLANNATMRNTGLAATSWPTTVPPTTCPCPTARNTARALAPTSATPTPGSSIEFKMWKGRESGAGARDPGLGRLEPAARYSSGEGGGRPASTSSTLLCSRSGGFWKLRRKEENIRMTGGVSFVQAGRADARGVSGPIQT
jgi:hypothetical protein